jgi:hypothetical protein
LRLKQSRPLDVRRAAVLCSDGSVDLARLRVLIEQGDPRAALLAAPGWERHELPTGHWAMFSLPSRLAGLLHDIATKLP